MEDTSFATVGKVKNSDERKKLGQTQRDLKTLTIKSVAINESKIRQRNYH